MGFSMPGNSRQSNAAPSNRVNKPYFVGFNTVDNPRPPYTLTNVDLIKRDLLNQFMTPIGGRVMLPDFGSRIYDYLFDPFDDLTRDSIVQDVVRVVSSEPRVSLTGVDVQWQDQSISVSISLLFKPDNITDDLFVTFTNQSQESF